MTSKSSKFPAAWTTTICALLILFVWTGLWYGDTFAGMIHLWMNSDSYAHGLLVVPLAAWLIWSDRKLIAQFEPKPSFRFLAPLIVVIFAWQLGELAAVNAVTQLAATLVVIITIMSLLGSQLSSRLAFPLAFLLFAVPIGEFMMPRLMEWTADFTVLALRATGIPVYRESLQFVIPSGTWSVVEACSGIRYMIASLMVGTLYAYLSYNSLKRRLIFIGLALVVPIVANWLRAYMIVMLGHFSNNKLAAGVDHLIYGWVFFGIVIFTMFAIGARWAQPRPAISEISQRSKASNASPHRLWTLVAILLVTIAAMPLVNQQINASANAENQSPQLVLESAPTTVPDVDWKPSWANPSAEYLNAFGNGQDQVGLYVAYYQNQNPTRKLISSTNMLVQYQDQNWLTTSQGKLELMIGEQPHTVRSAEIIQKSGSVPIRLLAYRWYWINGHLTTNDIEGKLYTALNQLIGRGDNCALIVIYTQNDANAPRRLQQFAAVNSKNIQKMLSQAGGNP